jgi:oligopeptidase B
MLCSIDISKSSSGRFLFVQSGGKVTSEQSFIDLADPKGKLTLIQARRHNILYDTYHVASQLWIVTNENALNFKLMYTGIDKPAAEHWKPLVPYDPEVIINRFIHHVIIYLIYDCHQLNR